MIFRLARSPVAPYRTITWFEGRSYPRRAISCPASDVLRGDSRGEAAIGGSRVVLPEDRAAGDQQVGASVAHRARVVGVHAAVDLYQDGARQRAAKLRDPPERLGHELLPRQPGVDAHAERNVRSLGRLGRVGDRGLRVERDACAEPELTRPRDRPGRIGGDLGVEGDAVAARLLDALEVLLGLGDHQMAVELSAVLVHEAGDRREHDRADRDLADEVPVADVEVEDAGARIEEHAELRAEAHEISSVDRRLDLGTSYPVGPRHRRTVSG